jgi:hypothetical protein
MVPYGPDSHIVSKVPFSSSRRPIGPGTPTTSSAARGETDAPRSRISRQASPRTSGARPDSTSIEVGRRDGCSRRRQRSRTPTAVRAPGEDLADFPPQVVVEGPGSGSEELRRRGSRRPEARRAARTGATRRRIRERDQRGMASPHEVGAASGGRRGLSRSCDLERDRTATTRLCALPTES